MKKTIPIMLILLIIVAGAMFLLKRPSALFAKQGDKETELNGITFMRKPPHDIDTGASPLALAQFAWSEFLSLNWKASYERSGNIRERGEPDDSWSYSNDNIPYPDLVVWETYAHRVEFRPGNDSMLPFDKIPTYSYVSGTFQGDPGADLHLFNNLDESNEIGSCNLYAYTKKYGEQQQVLYQAKVNMEEYNYIRSKYNTAAKFKEANINTLNNIKQYDAYYQGAQGTCDCAPSEKVICLPCGTGSNALGSRDPEGAIEVKTAWRKMLPDDGDAATYFKRKILTYRKNPDGSVRVINDIYLLIGLHIIHKTRNYPNFIFATWEHKDVTNPALSMGYVKLDTNGHEFGGIIAGYPRVNKVIQDVNTANVVAHRLLNRASPASIWKNYDLVGVQAQVTNNSSAPNFFLANYVIESDSTLQIFRGSSIRHNIDSGNNILYNHQRYSMGGCQGCHGVGQVHQGSDMSFLCDTVGKPVDSPDIGNTSNKRLRYERAFRVLDKTNIK